MVDYQDPVVLIQDYCAYTFAAKNVSLCSRLTYFDSNSVENLACRGWTLLVCLPRPLVP